MITVRRTTTTEISIVWGISAVVEDMEAAHGQQLGIYVVVGVSQ